MTPLMTWSDGAWIGRPTTEADIDRWLFPLLRRTPEPSWWPVHEDTYNSTQMLHSIARNPYFLYVDSGGVCQAAFMTEEHFLRQVYTVPPESIQVTDVAGPGLGWVTDPVARSRLIGFVYGALLQDAVHPFNRGSGAILGIPWVVADSRFSRSLTSSRPSKWDTIRRQWLTGQPAKLDQLGRAVYDHIRRKVVAKHFFKMPMSLHQVPDAGHAQGVANKMSADLHGIPRNERIAVLLRFEDPQYPASRDPQHQEGPLERRLWWEVRRVIEVRLPEGAHRTPPYKAVNYVYSKEILGRSEQGPLEALHAAGLFMPQTELEGWLETHGDFSGEPVFNLDMFEALEVGNPMLWPMDRFKLFAEQLSHGSTR